jgi:hypothetical protein
MKKTLALLLGALLAVPLAQAQVETGTSVGQQVLDESRSQAISAGRTQTENVSVAAGQVGSKEVVVVEEEEKWWSINAGTGWDSLYMFRGANILGNGNGIYWLSAGLGIVPWENGSFNANFWYGVGSWWNGANVQSPYGEVNVTLAYSHTFGALDLTAGWIYYHFPNTEDAFERIPTNQNEIFFGAAYNIEIGSVTITPNTTFYYNIGPEYGKTTGFANGGSSSWILGLNAEIPVAYDGAVSLAPYTQFGLNFGFNNSVSDASVDPILVRRFNGGNNWQTGVALPIQFTSWFGVSPYVAYSYQWQNIQSFGDGQSVTDVNTWWCGISANFSF